MWKYRMLPDEIRNIGMVLKMKTVEHTSNHRITQCRTPFSVADNTIL
jgi:hypothetical protein